MSLGTICCSQSAALVTDLSASQVGSGGLCLAGPSVKKVPLEGSSPTACTPGRGKLICAFAACTEAQAGSLITKAAPQAAASLQASQVASKLLLL